MRGFWKGESRAPASFGVTYKKGRSRKPGPSPTRPNAGPPTRFPTGLSEPINDTCLRDIVWGHLHLNSVSHGQTDKPFPHLSRDMGEDKVLVRKLHPKHGSREYSGNFSFNDY